MPFTTQVHCHESTIMLSAIGHLDASAEAALQHCLDRIPLQATAVMVDLHRVPEMDTHGLLLLLHLHRRAECLGLRVMVVGWQAQPQRLMAQVARIPGPGSSIAQRYQVPGFRQLLQRRAQETTCWPQLPAARPEPDAVGQPAAN
ncbi:STAS domain-containing protein [Streptomyces sp. CB00455]|uniref:STAS domain-containing protein n=1 Tax=Streptomyces sp. CB00455 TaxID=1703927 RepID=UPI000AF83960|nr:STAS domain-containing protein [Streptomyces sp. CB00455]